MTVPGRLPRARAFLLADLLVLVWAIVWVMIGVDVANEVRDVGRISATVARVGNAVERTGSSLEALSGLPVLGEKISEAGAPIREAGIQAQRSAALSRSSAEDLSVLLGISIAVVPSLPLLLLYLPRRVSMERDRRAVARALRTGGDADLEELMARLALVHLPLHVLRGVTHNPATDLASGRYGALAAAELERLGLDAPATWREDRVSR